MKQAIILIVTFAILLTFGIMEMNYLDRTSNYIIADLTYTRNGIINNNMELAKAHLKQVENTWHEMKRVWEMLIDHVEIDQIEDSMAQFRVYVENKEEVEAYAQYELLVRTFRHIANTKRILFENII